MKFGTKKRIVQVCLLVLAVWPLAHIAVVRSTGMSPWRGFGWGMYTVPVLNVDVGVQLLEGESGGDTREGYDAMVQAIKQYIKHYQALGRNAKPDAVASAVFAAYPGFEVIQINVKQNALDRDSARIVERSTHHFRCRRGGAIELVE